MEKLSIDTRAKINLTLDILSKRPDGYHNVSMVMQSISLCDTLHFQVIDKGIKITCSNRFLPTDGRNIVYKVANLLQEKFNIDKGIRVHIEKRIPFSAGLAGGSTNGAGTFKALNELWGLNLEDDEIMELGATIGADIPFCLMEGTALAEGIGEKLTRICDLPEFYIVLVKPKIRISTPWAYGLIDVENIRCHPDNKGMIEAIHKGDKAKIAEKLGNVFEEVIFQKQPELMTIKSKLRELGAMGELMSGSGPTIYGLFDSKAAAKRAKDNLAKDYREVFTVKSYKGG